MRWILQVVRINSLSDNGIEFSLNRPPHRNMTIIFCNSYQWPVNWMMKGWFGWDKLMLEQELHRNYTTTLKFSTKGICDRGTANDECLRKRCLIFHALSLSAVVTELSFQFKTVRLGFLRQIRYRLWFQKIGGWQELHGHFRNNLANADTSQLDSNAHGCRRSGQKKKKKKFKVI